MKYNLRFLSFTSTGPVLVKEPGTGSVPLLDCTGGYSTGSGTSAKFSSGQVLVMV